MHACDRDELLEQARQELDDVQAPLLAQMARASGPEFPWLLWASPTTTTTPASPSTSSPRPRRPRRARRTARAARPRASRWYWPAALQPLDRRRLDVGEAAALAATHRGTRVAFAWARDPRPAPADDLWRVLNRAGTG